MKVNKFPRAFVVVIVGAVCALNVPAAWSEDSIWAHDNLVAWCAAPPWDAKARGPEERAQMLKRLGFKHFAYNWRPPAIKSFDAEIKAMKRHGINLLGWALYGSDNPSLPLILEAFKRHDVHPQLWLMQGPMPGSPLWAQEFPRTAEEQARRIIEEADRIKALVLLVAPYGSKVNLYNHNGWFGMVENQLALIGRLREIGVGDVGMVYNFSHARDEVHDDSRNFRELWAKMRDHVVAVNVSGMRWEGQIVYPSQGDSELDMMRVIQESGWKGPVGVIAEKGGDAQVTLANYLKGLDWLAAELQRPGSAGPRPFAQRP